MTDVEKLVIAHEHQIKHLLKAIESLADTVKELADVQRESIRHEESTKSAHKRLDETTSRITQIEADIKELRKEKGCDAETCPIGQQVKGINGWGTWFSRIVFAALILALIGLIIKVKP